jgi:hypothetical protein
VLECERREEEAADLVADEPDACDGDEDEDMLDKGDPVRGYEDSLSNT